MSVIPVDKPPGAAGAVKPGGFWQWLARAIDEYFVDRTKRVVPETTLRRSRHEINRCRRLIHKDSLVPVAAIVNRASRGATQTQPQ